MASTMIDERASRVGAWSAPVSKLFQYRTAGSRFIDDIFATRSLVDNEGRTVPLETFIPAKQGDLLYSLVHYLKPLRTLEVGLANGISALHIAIAIRELGFGKHLALDPYQHTDWQSRGMVTIRRAGLAGVVELDARPSHWAVPDLEQAGHRIQFAFIDGSHLLDYVMTDFMAIDRILDVGGLIAFDDSDWPAVNQVIRFALANRDYTVFPTGVVIEAGPGRPRSLSNALRWIVRKTPSLQRIVRNDFVESSKKLGIDGRCVVLQKNGHDQRHALLGQLFRY